MVRWTVTLISLLLFAVLLWIGIEHWREKDARVPNYHSIQVSRMHSEELVRGNGKEALPGKKAQLFLHVWIYDPAAPENRGAQLIQNSVTVILGKHQVPIGVEKGVYGMKEGGKRRLLIPSILSEGSFLEGNVPVPKDAILLVEAELTSVSEGENS